MACILHIETSGTACSVALSDRGSVIFHEEDTDQHNHARVLAPFCDEAMSFADSHALPLDAVAVSRGPGSYTGLRIGVSTAKGICYARGLKLIAVDTLSLICVPSLLGEKIPENALICPMIDARRMEVYSTILDRSLKTVRGVQADIVTAETYREWLDCQPVYFLGNGAMKCKDIINHPNAHFIDGQEPLAKNMMPLAEMALLRGQTEDVAYFEPFYLKEFEVKKSQNPLLQVMEKS